MKINTDGLNKVGNAVMGFAQKNGPMCMIVGGIFGFGVTTVMAVKNSYKADNAIDRAKVTIKRAKNNGDKKEVTKAYFVGTGEVAKCFTPAVCMGLASTALILGGTKIINDRYATAISAASLLETQFNRYRANVVEEFGEDVDYRMRNSIHKDKIKVTEIGEDGKKHTKTKEVDVLSDEPVTYAVVFNGETAPSVFNKSSRVMNLDKIRVAERYANEILHAKGHIFLNEVYEMLGVRKTTAGQLVGWLDRKVYGDVATGDDYVAFDIHEVYIEGEVVPDVLIDFNVDGLIFDKINKSDKYAAPGYLKFPSVR